MTCGTQDITELGRDGACDGRVAGHLSILLFFLLDGTQDLHNEVNPQPFYNFLKLLRQGPHKSLICPSWS